MISCFHCKRKRCSLNTPGKRIKRQQRQARPPEPRARGSPPRGASAFPRADAHADGNPVGPAEAPQTLPPKWPYHSFLTTQPRSGEGLGQFPPWEEQQGGPLVSVRTAFPAPPGRPQQWGPAPSPGARSHVGSSHPQPGLSEPPRGPPTQSQRRGGGSKTKVPGKGGTSPRSRSRTRDAMEAPARASALMAPKYTVKAGMEWKLRRPCLSRTKMQDSRQDGGHPCPSPSRGRWTDCRGPTPWLGRADLAPPATAGEGRGGGRTVCDHPLEEELPESCNNVGAGPGRTSVNWKQLISIYRDPPMTLDGLTEPCLSRPVI